MRESAGVLQGMAEEVTLGHQRVVMHNDCEEVLEESSPSGSFILLKRAMDSTLLEEVINLYSGASLSNVAREGDWFEGAEMVQRPKGIPPASLRNCKLLWFNGQEHAPHLFQRLVSLARLGTMELHLNELSKYEDCQLAEYGPGQHYKAWHRDSDISPEQDARQLTVLLMLSHPSEYEGGQFQIRLSGGPESKQKKRKRCSIFFVPLGYGDVLIFPSRLLEHRVTPLISGLRRTLILWASGSRCFEAVSGSKIRTIKYKAFRRERRFAKLEYARQRTLLIIQRIRAGGVAGAKACQQAMLRLQRFAKNGAWEGVIRLHLGVALGRVVSCLVPLREEVLIFVEAFAELLNEVAELLWALFTNCASPGNLKQKALTQLCDDVLPLMVDLLGHPAYEIPDSVEPFFTLFISDVSRDAHYLDISPMADEVCLIILKHVRQIVIYPDWFQHELLLEALDERHVKFLELRKSYMQLVRQVCSLRRAFCIDALESLVCCCASILTPLSKLPWEIEANVVLLSLLYKELGRSHKNVLIPKYVRLLSCEPLISYDHWGVQLALMDVYLLFGRHALNCGTDVAPVLWKILEALSGIQGLRSADTRLIRRSSFVLTQVLQVHSEHFAKDVIRMYAALEGVLVDGSRILTLEESLHLYGALGEVAQEATHEELCALGDRILVSKGSELSELCSCGVHGWSISVRDRAEILFAVIAAFLQPLRARADAAALVSSSAPACDENCISRFSKCVSSLVQMARKLREQILEDESFQQHLHVLMSFSTKTLEK